MVRISDSDQGKISAILTSDVLIYSQLPYLLLLSMPLPFIFAGNFYNGYKAGGYSIFIGTAVLVSILLITKCLSILLKKYQVFLHRVSKILLSG